MSTFRLAKNPLSYEGRYPRIYAALKHYGFSPAMAIRVIIDATRHDHYAQRIIRLAREGRTVTGARKWSGL